MSLGGACWLSLVTNDTALFSLPPRYPLLQSFQHLQVGREGMVDLADLDEFIGTVGARRLAGAELQRGEGHQCLITERRRAERLQAKRHTTLDERVLGVDARRM